MIAYQYEVICGPYYIPVIVEYNHTIYGGDNITGTIDIKEVRINGNLPTNLINLEHILEFTVFVGNAGENQIKRIISKEAIRAVNSKLTEINKKYRR